MSQTAHIETQVIHAGNPPDPETGATVNPIAQSTAFAYESAEELESVFRGTAPGYVYSRISNPTVMGFERRIAALEGGIGALACASGMAAIATTVLALVGNDETIVSGAGIFGGTHSLFTATYGRCGIKTRFVDTSDLDAVRDALSEDAKLLFVETVGNPKLDVPDLQALADIAHEAGVPFVVDSTTTTPVLIRPKDFGADLVIHSTSKFINGQGTAIGGVVVDSGTFNWAALPQFESFRRAGAFTFLAALRNRFNRDLGACLSPFNAFLTSNGLETLALRMERHCDNALAIASALNDDPRIEVVRYPGLAGHPDHDLAKRQFNGRYGALLTLRLGSRERCFKFINGLQYIRNLANLGDTRSLAIHPASTFCRDATPAQQEAMGVYDDLVRIAVGIEHVDDLLTDISQSLDQI